MVKNLAKSASKFQNEQKFEKNKLKFSYYIYRSNFILFFSYYITLLAFKLKSYYYFELLKLLIVPILLLLLILLLFIVSFLSSGSECSETLYQVYDTAVYYTGITHNTPQLTIMKDNTNR